MKSFVITNNTGFSKSYSQVLDNNGRMEKKKKKKKK